MQMRLSIQSSGFILWYGSTTESVLTVECDQLFPTSIRKRDWENAIDKVLLLLTDRQAHQNWEKIKSGMCQG